MGLVRSFQDVRLMHRLTCLQNVMLAVQDQSGENLGKLLFGGRAARRSEVETREKAMDWLGFVGMAEFANIPAGSLSYGACKRLEIARALAAEPRVLLLDEPAAGCNSVETEEIDRLICRVAEKGIAVVLVEHDMKLVMRISNRILVLERGRRLIEGSPEEVRGNSAVLEAYLGKHGAREAARA